MHSTEYDFDIVVVYVHTQPLTTNCAVAIRDHHRAMPGSGEHLLGFSTGSLITSVDTGTSEEGLWRGNHRGDKGMLLPSSHVRLLTKDEMEYVSDLVSLPPYCTAIEQRY